MPPLELLLPFFLASALFALVPGPGMLYAAARTIAHGRRAGRLSAIGLHLGGLVHIAAAAFGLAVLLETIPALYAALKLTGAAYLVWLGIACLLPPAARAPSAHEAGGRQPLALKESILVEVLNPKTALFYLAFLPQFTEVSAALPLWAQILALGGIVNLMFSLTDLLCIELSGAVSSRLSRGTARWARRAGGVVLIGLGIRLALTRD